jgi:fatty acid desaturase
MSDDAVPQSAKLGDSCLREIPQLLSKQEIRDFSGIESTKFTAAMALEFSLIVAAVCISETWFNPLTYVLAVIVVGSRIHALGALMHDTVHYRAYSNRLMNDVVGEILALPTSISMAGYRNTHFGHHRELNSEDDPDWRKYSKTKEYEFPASRASMWVRIARHLSGLQAIVEMIRVHLQKHPDRLDVPAWVSRGRLVFLVVLAVSAIVFGFWKLLLLYWVVPLLTVFLAIRYFRNVAEHYMVEHENVLNETRTVIAPSWQLWLIAPWGINYHIEHHLFPSVPCFRLAELHRLLMTRAPYPQLAHVTYGYFGGLLRECASANPAERVAA